MNKLVMWIMTTLMAMRGFDFCLQDENHVPRAGCVKDSIETQVEKEARYRSIVQDLVEVVYDDTEAPISTFTGDKRREASLFVVLAVAKMESGLRRDVDYGIGPLARGDNGRSWCLMQMNIGNGKTKEGWTGPELVADRKKCLRSGYRVIKSSFGSCSALPIDQRLSLYAGGSCDKGREASKIRVGLARYWHASAPKIIDMDGIKSAKFNFWLNDESEKNNADSSDVATTTVTIGNQDTVIQDAQKSSIIIVD